MIVLMAGLPGTGKSTIARGLAARCGGIVLDKDTIRAALFPPSRVEYSVRQDDFCQAVMIETAGYLLGRDASLFVFLDGRTFSRRYQRENAIAFAGRIGTPWAIVECVCRPESALERLARDAAAGTHPAQNRTPELYLALRDSFEPIEVPKLLLDTDAPETECVARAAAWLKLS